MGRASRRKQQRHQTFVVRSYPRQPVRVCPVCQARLDGCTRVSLNDDGDDTPLQVGDISMCIDCKAVLIATADGFRLITQEEFDQIDPGLRELYARLPTNRRPPRENLE